MIRVGITENVKLKGAEINDKGTLSLSFVQDGVSAPVTDVNDLLNKAADVKAFNGSTGVMLFPPSTEYNGVKREVKGIAVALGGFRDQLEHILQGYMTSDQATLDPYAGIDTSNVIAFQNSLTQEATITKIYKNLANGFIAKLKSIQGDLDSKLFRLLLVRRSAKNHYGTLRSRFISSNPFWEPMSIPANQSNLHFTTYEIGKGLNSGEPVSPDANTETTTSSSNAAEDILGSR